MNRKQRTAPGRRIGRTVPADIEQLMRSLDGIERAKPRPFFATRADARLDRLQARHQPVGWAFRPLVLTLSLGLMLLVNVGAAVVFGHYLTPIEPTTTGTDRFATDWQLTDDLNW